MAKRKDELIFLQNHIKQTNEQGQQLEQIIERMLDMEDRVENRVSYVEDMVEEIKKEVPITYEQQKELQSIVQSKANQFTREYYKDGFNVESKYQNELFKKKKRSIHSCNVDTIKRIFQRTSLYSYSESRL